MQDLKLVKLLLPRYKVRDSFRHSNLLKVTNVQSASNLITWGYAYAAGTCNRVRVRRADPGARRREKPLGLPRIELY